MKFKKPFLFFILSLIISSPSLKATSTTDQQCPSRYLAEVVRVADSGSNALFEKILVEFKIHKTQKGQKLNTKTIEVIKDGPDKFSVGHSYVLETDRDWLCAAREYSANE